MKPNLLLTLGCLGLFSIVPQADDARTARRLFADPPREFATAPLWVWNDRLTEDQIRGTLRDLAGQSVRQVFVHPRPGLMTPYLGEEWFRLWRVALEEAARLDMNVWIYDENSYPSGFAGGWVPEHMPEARGRGLHFREVRNASWTANTLAVFRLHDGNAEDISAALRTGEPLPEARYLAAEMRRSGDSPWHGNRSYVDLLYPGVTERFLDITLGAYEREIGSHLGKRVPGVFTDEPNIIPAGGLPWTEDLPEQFEQRWGYPLLPALAALHLEVDDWRMIRHHYFQTLLDLFIERWGRPFYNRCEQLGLEFTGHYWEHEWPECRGVPDNMAMAAWQHRPGIDILMNQYAEHTHAQFGNVRSAREVSSVANQLGRRRTLVEVYGAGGWDLRFEDMKRIGDWLLVLGVNTLDEHLSYITIRGARKRDHPQSFSYHAPWWDSYGVLARYFTRLSAALSQGHAIHPILVLQPTTTAWMYQGHTDRLRQLGNDFSRLLMQLEAAQLEYDLGAENILSREGTLATSPSTPNPQPRLRVGQRDYAVIVLPPHTENLNTATLILLHRFLHAGGRVVSAGPPPSRLDGRPAPRLAELASQPGWTQVEPDAAAPLLGHLARPADFDLVREPDDRGILFHHRRQLADGELVFLANTSIEHPARGLLNTRRTSIELWDPFAATTTPEAFEQRDGWTSVAFELPPCGSRLFFLSNRPLRPRTTPQLHERVHRTPPALVEIERLEPNVLTLDYVDVIANEQSLTHAYFYQAQQFVFRQNGMDRNPWDSAVQFRDELIRRTFPPASGFIAHFRFTLEGSVPADLEAVVERPDLYRITCNGQPVQAVPGAWWLDRSFGRLPIAATARLGSNVLTLTAQPFTIEHELEPVYLRGNFHLRTVPNGFVIVPAATLRLGETAPDPDPGILPNGWNHQGLPFYAGGVVYRQALEIGEPVGRFFVSLPAWHGSVARVRVNGQPAGTIVSAPWECEITTAVQSGTQQVEVEVVGTLKNTLGPHHGNPARGTAWPGMFHHAPQPGPPPGSQYDTIAYGLFAPFEVRQVIEK
jgi:hypothetical protein